MRNAAILAVIVSLAAIPVAGRAGSISDDQLLKLFQTQRDAFKDARSTPTGKTRGLSLVTVESVTAGTSSPTMPVASAESGKPTAVASSDGGVAVTANPKPLDQPKTDGIDLANATHSTKPAVIAATGGGTATTQPVVYGVLDAPLVIDRNIRFGFDSSALSPDQKPLLAQLCRVMKSSDIKRFQIIGHTDASGTDAYNEQLSRLRAEEVVRYFVTDCGMDPARLEAVGYGKRFLKNKDDPRGPENRRVEFQAVS